MRFVRPPRFCRGDVAINQNAAIDSGQNFAHEGFDGGVLVELEVSAVEVGFVVGDCAAGEVCSIGRMRLRRGWQTFSGELRQFCEVALGVKLRWIGKKKEAERVIGGRFDKTPSEGGKNAGERVATRSTRH